MAALRARSPKSKSNASDRAVRDPATRAWQQAIRLLAAHDRSEQEVRTRLAMSGAPPATIEATIRRLYELRYLDDQRFAHSTAEQARRRGYGSEYVRAQLASKGVADSLIDEALRGALGDETELARHALARRYPGEPQRPAERAKAARFLLRRGFPEAVIATVLGDLW